MFPWNVDLFGPEEEGPRSSPRLFWELVKTEGSALLLLNVVFLLTCVPLVTIPPAIFALNRVVRGMLIGKTGRLKDYFAAFKSSWGRGWCAFLLTVLPLIGAGYGVRFYFYFAKSNWIFFLPFMLCTTVFIVVLLASVYLYRLLANERGLTKESIRLAVMLSVGRPSRAVLAALWYYVPLTIAILRFPLSGLYLFLIGFSVPCLLGNLVLRKAPLLDEGIE